MSRRRYQGDNAAPNLAQPKPPPRKPGQHEGPHPWRKFRPGHRKWAGVDWVTGEPIPNTLEAWVRSAVRGYRGVVLDTAKTVELARVMGWDQPLPVQDQGEGLNSLESAIPDSSK